ncbi:uncharacterized protein LOC119079537 isoform X2 [Bradysia coprophila]|uniref:uncharacterized protein LOC119079537 isoform X2 n=1 Tax=Bradysia coprophila TaxID=38358 RepID=UPI00187D9CC6|nr:uncharacterized protein LOC119079537 isoform X2 [Bradysia coprophila]
MSLESQESKLNDEKAINTSQQNDLFLTKIASSPLMFDDEIISNGIQTLPDPAYTFNQVLSTMDSTLPSQWTPNVKIPSGTGYTNVPRSDQTDTILLSMSSIERVSTCGLCDCTNNLNESNDYHNRTVTDVTVIDGLNGHLEKRARFTETPEVAPDILLISDTGSIKTSVESSNVLRMLAESTKAINDHLMSLHADCGEHLTMAKNIIGPMDI